MQNPIARTMLACLSLVLLAPAALATPALTVDADANNTVFCQANPQTVGSPDLYASLNDDCSATAHADTNNVSAQCNPQSTGDVVPGFRSASVSTDGSCDAFVAVSA